MTRPPRGRRAERERLSRQRPADAARSPGTRSVAAAAAPLGAPQCASDERRFVVEGADAGRRGARRRRRASRRSSSTPAARRRRRRRAPRPRGAGVRVVRPGVLARVADTVTPQAVAAVAPSSDAAARRRADDAATVRCVVLRRRRRPGQRRHAAALAEAAGAGGGTVLRRLGRSVQPEDRAGVGRLAVPRAGRGRRRRRCRCCERWATRGVRRLGTVGARRHALRRGRPHRPVALVLGSEAHGLPDAVRPRSTSCVTIPMAGRVESLNVGDGRRRRLLRGGPPARGRADDRDRSTRCPTRSLALDARPSRRRRPTRPPLALTGRRRPSSSASRSASLLARAVDGSPLLADGWHSSTALPRSRGMPEHEVTIRAADGDVRVRVTGRYQRDATARSAAPCSCCARRARPSDEPTRHRGRVDGQPRAAQPAHLGEGLHVAAAQPVGPARRTSRSSMMLEQVHHDADRVTRLDHRAARHQPARDRPARAAPPAGRPRRRWPTQRRREGARSTYPDLDCADRVPPTTSRRSTPTPTRSSRSSPTSSRTPPSTRARTGMRVDGRRRRRRVAVAVADTRRGHPAGRPAAGVHASSSGATMGKPTGTGLGLWISRGLVEAHGGRLVGRVRSLGEGSTFRFTLPLVDVDDRSAPELIDASPTDGRVSPP